jgi:hypothetical protein
MKTNIRYWLTKRTTSVLAIMAVLVVGEPAARAQFGLLPSTKTAAPGTGSGVGLDAFRKSANDVISNVLSARITLMDAKAKLMGAMGLNTDSVAQASQTLRDKVGNTSANDVVNGIEESKKTTAEADKQFAGSLAQGQSLPAGAKATFTEGAGKYIEGLLLEKDQIGELQKLVQMGQSLTQSASVFDMPKLLGLVKPVNTLSTVVPADVKDGTATLGNITQYAKGQSIDSIPNADRAAASLGPPQ